MVLFLLSREGSICMILFCNAFTMYISLLFSAGSKLTKTSFTAAWYFCVVHLLNFGHCVLGPIVPVLYLEYLLNGVDIQ
jgi:hypothetical protein